MSNERREIGQISFELMREAYKEVDKSFESINTRAGVALALIGTSLSAAQFEIWEFQKPIYPDHWFLWLLSDVFNLASAAFMTLGTIFVVLSLFVRQQETPYRMDTLTNQQPTKTTSYQDMFEDLDSFYKQQRLNTRDAFEKLNAALSVKAKYFNFGIVFVLIALGLVVIAKLIV